MRLIFNRWTLWHLFPSQSVNFGERFILSRWRNTHNNIKQGGWWYGLKQLVNEHKISWLDQSKRRPFIYQFKRFNVLRMGNNSLKGWVKRRYHRISTLECIERLLQKKACFAVGANVFSIKLSDEEVLSGYLGPSSVESEFRFFKDPYFFTSSLFLKIPSRIESLLSMRSWRYSPTQSLNKKVIYFTCGMAFMIWALGSWSYSDYATSAMWVLFEKVINSPTFYTQLMLSG